MAYLDYDGLEYFKGKLDAEIFPAYVTPTASGDIASFPDGADEVPMRRLVANIEPVQDLHGQANPYPPGGGKNLLLITATTATVNGLTFTIDSTVGSVRLTNTRTGNGTVVLSDSVSLKAGTYKLVCPQSTDDFYLRAVSGGDRIAYVPQSPEFTLAEDTTITIDIFCRGGVNANGLTLYPMVMLSSISDTSFAPYSNICPISGWTEANGKRTGKNLLPVYSYGDSGTYNGITWVNNHDGSVTISGTCSGGNSYFGNNSIGQNLGVLPSGDYTVSAFLADGTTFNSLDIKIGTGATGTYLSDGGGHVTFTADGVTEYCVSPRIINGTAITGSVTVYLQMERGSGYTTYEPYQGETISIAFPSSAGTVYGGTLNVTSGELTVDRATHTVGTSDSTRLFGSLTNCVRVGIVTSGAKAPAWDTQEELDIISNCAKTDSSPIHSSSTATANECCLYKDGSYVIAVFTVPTGSGASASAALQYLIDNGCVYCYPLATPQTYQLTPTQVTTLLGTNNVWFDCGSTECTYRADTKIYIDNQLTQAIANALNA